MAEKEAGQEAFERYNHAVGGKTYDGKDLHWGMIGERQRKGWAAVEVHITPMMRVVLGELHRIEGDVERRRDRVVRAVIDAAAAGNMEGVERTLAGEEGK